MVMTKQQCGPDLGIALEGGRTAFRLGETIRGCVSRETPTALPDAVVKVAVLGRYVDRSVRDDSGACHGRFDLVDGKRRAQTLFSGTLHIPPGAEGARREWPFAIRMPTYADPSPGHGGLFLSSEQQPVKAQRLPPSLWVRSALKESYVEYFIQADLWYRSQGSWDNVAATLPIYVPFIRPGPPLVDYQVVVMGVHMSASSHRFLPGMGDAKLSTSQKMKKAFNISSAPTCGLKLQVGFPSYIQIGNPGVVPFQVRLVPQWERTSEEILNIPQRARLTGISLEILSHCRITEQRGSSTVDTEYKFNMDLFGEKCALPPPPDLEIPCSGAVPPIDIGQCCGLTSPADGSFVVRDGMLTPSFNTFNIALAHGLAWTLRFEIAGEVLVAEGLQALTVLPPCDPTEKNLPIPPPKRQRRSYFEMAPPRYDAGDMPPAFSEIGGADSSNGRISEEETSSQFPTLTTE